jgi:NADPH:quinone reductase-like Zn-dependent oxidoreductase
MAREAEAGEIEMKALLSVAPGGPETLVLTERPRPAAGAGELCVRVLACGINFPDVLIIEDKYQLRPERPFAPGAEIAGEVVEVGAGVLGWQPGDRMIAAIGYGGLAEMVSVAADRAVPLPDWADPEGAAALLMTYATTIHALVDRGQLRAGETLLVLGAAGGTGIAAIEIGKTLGARVVAACSTPEKAEIARAVGADETVVYGRAPFDRPASKALADAFKQAVGPAGADVVYDPVGGDYADPAIRSLAWYGRYLVIGFTAGIPRLPLNLALLKSCDIRGVFWGGFVGREPDRNRANVEQLFAWWREGRIKPRIERVWPLADGAQAIAWLRERQAVGKAVIRVSA